MKDSIDRYILWTLIGVGVGTGLEYLISNGMDKQ